MRKLRLELDELKVSSFATQATSTARGTVQARSHNTEFCTQEMSCQINSYVCTDTHYWAGCPTGGNEICPILPPRGLTDG